jgi:multiple sugar transport system permease protein
MATERSALSGRAAGPSRADRPRRASRRGGSLAPAHRQDARVAWLFISPAVLGFLVFAAYPTVRGFYLSFTDFRVLSPPSWVGLDNFKALIHDDVFWNSLKVTTYFVILSVVFGLLLSIATAVVLHRLTGSTVIRGLIIVPFLISGVVAATVWSWMLDGQLGIINVVLTSLGAGPIRFLSSPNWAIPSIAMISVWKSFGYTAIIIFAGLETIPATIYEAGRIDGASEIQMFRRLTLPLLRPILALVIVLNLIGAFQVFDIVQVATKGGPANATNVLQMYIYSKAFGQFQFGYASAMSLSLFALLIVITFMQMRLLRAGESDLA